MSPLSAAAPPTVVSCRHASQLYGVPRAKLAALIWAGVLKATVVGPAHCISLDDLERLRSDRPDLFPTAAS